MHLEGAVQGEAGDLVVHREAVQAIVVGGPVLVVVERARVHERGIGAVSRVGVARRAGRARRHARAGSGGTSTLRLGRLCGRSCMTSRSGASGVFDTRPAVTKVSVPPSGRLAVER